MEFIANKYFVTNLLQAKKKEDKYNSIYSKTQGYNKLKYNEKKYKQDHIPFASPILDNRYT